MGDQWIGYKFPWEVREHEVGEVPDEASDSEYLLAWLVLNSVDMLDNDPIDAKLLSVWFNGFEYT
jgi:hypothetical protein